MCVCVCVEFRFSYDVGACGLGVAEASAAAGFQGDRGRESHAESGKAWLSRLGVSEHRLIDCGRT